MKETRNQHIIQKYAKTIGYQCANPGCISGRNVEVHHVLPIKSGGPDKYWNFICLCKKCHHKEKSKLHKDHKENDMELFVWKTLQELKLFGKPLEDKNDNDSDNLPLPLLTYPLPKKKPRTPKKKAPLKLPTPIPTPPKPRKVSRPVKKLKPRIGPPAKLTRQVEKPKIKEKIKEKIEEIPEIPEPKIGLPIGGKAGKYPMNVEADDLFFDGLEKQWYIIEASVHKYKEPIPSLA